VNGERLEGQARLRVWKLGIKSMLDTLPINDRIEL
jgi:hypothetical protein